ncbi:hypothetical protein SLEP1_g55800 [Rubroshorea leprosula]|uniref:Uncharacterized protein n=1 Tax=Rubroshorea leprosula TaxID=152421 RepID=A0AAV5MGF6_9ROSI|nr:hypothetical protein SLEP1_g55800 [Rubroshorea leprosula]
MGSFWDFNFSIIATPNFGTIGWAIGRKSPRLQSPMNSQVPPSSIISDFCTGFGVINSKWKVQVHYQVEIQLHTRRYAPICANDGEAIEEGGINDDAHGLSFKIASNGEGQQEK